MYIRNIGPFKYIIANKKWMLDNEENEEGGDGRMNIMRVYRPILYTHMYNIYTHI